MIATVGIGELGYRASLFEDILRFGCSHPLAVGRHLWALPFAGSIRVFTGLNLLLLVV